MEINKFDREETIRRFLSKQNWPEFSNNDSDNNKCNIKVQTQQEQEQEEMIEEKKKEESEPNDNYLKDSNWKLKSNNCLKRNSISKSYIMNNHDDILIVFQKGFIDCIVVDDDDEPPMKKIIVEDFNDD